MLIEGKIKASIFISEIQFTIHMDYTISGKNQYGAIGTDWSIAYWRFKFNNERLRKRYGLSLIHI